jgi:hypothetical protein
MFPARFQERKIKGYKVTFIAFRQSPLQAAEKCIHLWIALPHSRILLDGRRLCLRENEKLEVSRHSRLDGVCGIYEICDYFCFHKSFAFATEVHSNP